jgi:hypothetical protein
VSDIARETVNLRREIRNKKRNPDAEATATATCYVELLSSRRSETLWFEEEKS